MTVLRRQSAVVTRNHRAYVEAHRKPIEDHVRSFAGVRATMRWLLYDCVHTEVGRPAEGHQAIVFRAACTRIGGKGVCACGPEGGSKPLRIENKTSSNRWGVRRRAGY